MLKKILAFFIGLALLVPTFGTPFLVSAAIGIEFKIEAPATARVGEAIDVTVKAVRKDGQIATDYRGSIVFSTKWIGDTVPMPGKWVPFTDEDNGEKKFSKWVIFKKAGKQELYVSDLSDDITGEVSIVVEEGVDSSESNSEEISIITPAADAKIAGSMVMVSGKTRKNSKVSIELNGSNVGTALSDGDGLFTKEIQGISQENNILKVSLLDATNSVVATSPEVKFSKENNEGSVYGVVISPSTTVEPSADVTFTIESAKWLSEVSLVIDGATLNAKEVSDGKYTAETKAPQKVGVYPISVTTKTLTAQAMTQENMATLTVEAKKEEPKPTPTFKNVKAETKDLRVTFSFAVENVPQDLSTFRITYGATGAVITQTVDKILKDGIYTWYIDKLAPGEHTFKIFGQKMDGGLIDGLVSDPIMATIGVQSCTISNVGKISVKTDTSKSVLSWDSVENAAAYNVYRIEADGKYSLVQKVTTPSYTLYLSKGAVTYDNFAVKAICGDNTESKDYSEASKVQTGPGAIAFIVIVSAFVAGFILRRRAS